MQHYTVHLFLKNCSTCFGWYLHTSSGAHTAVFTVSGTCQTLLLPAAIVEELELVWVWFGSYTDLFWCGCWPDTANTAVCAPDDVWRYHPKHVEQFSRNK